ncbi:MAG: alpha/beta fold hydrolase [Pseudohongiellaceae bacterium]|jgi:poly(3-hydroxybutyrate) depolymerase
MLRRRCLQLGLALAASTSLPPRALQAATPPTGSQHIDYLFAATGESMPLRYYVPSTWDGNQSLPIVLMLHGAGADENSYMDRSDGQLQRLAEAHGYIVVSPLGHTPLGAYGNPLRLPAVFGQDAVATQQAAAVDAARQRTLALSELEVITALELVTERYGADRRRTFLAGHSMGSGGVWHLAARYPERWRAIAPLSGPFVNRSSYPFERLRALPIFMTEGRGATPSLEGSRAMAAFLRERAFDVDYLETGGDHGGMVSEVLPAIFDFFDRHR